MTRFDTRPLLSTFAEALTLVAMAGLTGLSVAAYAYAPQDTGIHEKLPTVVVTAEAAIHEQLPTVVITSKRAS
jgi:hypothetical protein